VTSQNTLAHQANLTVILPYLNELLTIGGTVAEFAACFPESPILLVDNGSSDGSSLAAKQALIDASFTNFRVIHVPFIGKGRALRRAFEEASTEYVVLADADLTYAASDAMKLFSLALTSGYDMVVGTRFSASEARAIPRRHPRGAYMELPGRRRFHASGNFLVNSLVSRLGSSRPEKMSDVMSGLRVIRRALYKSYPCDVDGFEVETDLTLFALSRGFSVGEEEISIRDRPSGSKSKLSTFTDGFRILRVIHRSTRNGRPLLYFGGLGFCSAVVAGTLGLYVLNDFLQDGFIEVIPSAILAASLGTLSVLAVMTGFIVDAVKFSVRAAN